MNPKGIAFTYSSFFSLFIYTFITKKIWVETYMFKWVQPVDGLIGSVQILSH